MPAHFLPDNFLINPEHVTTTQADGYRLRLAARAIVFNREGKIALLHVQRHHYYKLPGGGVKEGEDFETALTRECQEEIGCAVQITSVLGSTTEYRKIHGLKQISRCYIAEVTGKIEEPQFTPYEQKLSFAPLWCFPEKAFEWLSETNTKDIEGRDYIMPRDAFFLKKMLNITD